MWTWAIPSCMSDDPQGLLQSVPQLLLECVREMVTYIKKFSVTLFSSHLRCQL